MSTIRDDGNGMRSRMKDVAQQAGVSTATVSHVINGTRYVAENTKKKVYDAMKELNYSPNFIARSLRSNASKTIGLIIPAKEMDTSGFFFMAVAHSIEKKLKEVGYQLILSNSNEDIESEMQQINMFKNQMIDGLIMAPTYGDHSYLKEFEQQMPIVFIDREPMGIDCDCVLVDNYKGTYDAIRLLIEKGHKDIGYISGPLGLTTSNERIAGYKDALREYDLSYKEEHVVIEEPSLEAGKKAMAQLLEETNCTAVMVANNILTLGSVVTLNERNIKVPDDLAMIGYDNYEWTEATNPPLTVIKQPIHEIGEQAAELLIARLEDREAETRHISLPSRLEERQSC
ncbi:MULTISPECIES: LacI family DNA-binding transcriptional regulator [Pontibacillus]|uniref:LacI family DNA-binding transcriptional regulator n=1 Tax=Pontibacillus chungwhensis TaxID=265426 RepID=A0ABY8V0I7_9BACI|nr:MULTISPECIES: LacI family DNA-binding transcriptional regulator [Pontibacillus]MCD5324579.1 LacI family transcriptional regulator [Pontibacillus sp. HN14]WIF99125.1 LacI family DNA-binding transcriptional regulator [Pontibacillus chungwhensis]